MPPPGKGQIALNKLAHAGLSGSSCSREPPTGQRPRKQVGRGREERWTGGGEDLDIFLAGQEVLKASA